MRIADFKALSAVKQGRLFMGRQSNVESKKEPIRYRCSLAYFEVMHEEAGFEDDELHPDAVVSDLDGAEVYLHFSDHSH